MLIYGTGTVNRTDKYGYHAYFALKMANNPTFTIK